AALVDDGATLQMGIGAIPDAVLRRLGDKHDLGVHTEMFSDGLIPLIEDGATLQMGIGAIPDAVLSRLGDKHDLGVHTEMLSDGVMNLAEAGVINGRCKTLLPGKIVTSFMLGTQKLYRWAHDHPALEMRPSEFTNDPFTIARNDRMVAINGALAVDLTGQVAADTLDGCFFSGIGGQVDFIRGAARSKGGRPIIALPSTAKKGAVSRITPMLEPGTGVVTSRGDVRYVVTEYGVADLWGKSIRQRASALISVAHPDFRGELVAAAKARHWVLPDHPVPRGRYPWADERQEALPRGERVLIRPARLADERALQDLLYRLSDETVYRRFLAHRRIHPRNEVQDLVDLDYADNMAIVAALPDSGELIAIARYDLDPATNLADLAFLVRDDWQGRGVGTALMRRMAEIAQSRGSSGFTLDVLTTNRPMLSVIHQSGLKITSESEAGTYHVTARFPEPASAAARAAACP
ncbi:MAG TPA: GNAT family N-acetyltransferase, partial [Myxococcales bacterium]|nr:GNAT family N-acetyltransferase [Myxococcales bacterium]